MGHKSHKSCESVMTVRTSSQRNCCTLIHFLRHAIEVKSERRLGLIVEHYILSSRVRYLHTKVFDECEIIEK